MGVDNISEEIFRELMPYASRKVLEAKKDTNRSFVHYTSAEALLKILKSGEIWLRNTATMNDFSEVEYGLIRLAEAWESEVGNEFRALLDDIHPGISDKLKEYHNGWQDSYSNNTYLFAVSEHKASENEYGRLSMWREYARKSGVALVLNTAPFESETNLLRAYTVPVMYADSDSFIAHFSQITKNIRTYSNELKFVSSESLLGSIFQVFRFMSLSTKHPGFGEELEWRVVYNPAMEESPYIQRRIETISSVPQQICALSLNKIEDSGETLDLSFEAITKQVIIGPTDLQTTIGEAVVEALEEAGVSRAADRLIYSKIPVRT